MKIKKILISQPEPQSEKSPYFDIAARHGVESLLPSVHQGGGPSGPRVPPGEINLADYTGIIFTSARPWTTT